MCHIDPGAGDGIAVFAPCNCGLRIATIHGTQDKTSRVFCNILLFGDIQKSWILYMGEKREERLKHSPSKTKHPSLFTT